MRVYVSSPYSLGGVEANVRTAINAATELLDAGYWPYVPLLCHFWHQQRPRDYETWMALDLAWLAVCDCVLRLPGESPGADREVARAHELGLPVYGSVEEVLQSS